MRELKRRCDEVRAASRTEHDAQKAYAAIQARRYLRSWTEFDGAVRLDGLFAPLDGAKVLAAIEAESRHHFDLARRQARREPAAAYAADALVSLLSNGSAGWDAGGAGGVGAPVSEATSPPGSAGERRGGVGAGGASGRHPAGEAGEPGGASGERFSTNAGDLSQESSVSSRDWVADALLTGAGGSGWPAGGQNPQPGSRTGSFAGDSKATSGSPGCEPADDSDGLPGSSELVADGAAISGRGDSSRRGDRARSGATVHLRVDLAALKRGELASGELCEIPGVGPVPLSTANDVLGDALVHLVITDGVDVQSVTNLGRTVPSAARVALVERDPVCVVPGCDEARNLEIDHWKEPFWKCRSTGLAGLCRICRAHHHLKTYKGFVLKGGPGNWIWLTPDDQRAGASGAEPSQGPGPAPEGPA